MDDEEDLHGGGNLRGGQLDLLHVEVVLQFADEIPRRLLAALLAHAHHHRVHRRAEDGQRGHDADDRLGRVRDARDGAGEVILQQLLALGREERQRDLLVEAVDGDAEVNLLAGLRGLAFDAVEVRGVLGIGVGLRVELLDFDELGLLAQLGEQVLDALGVGLEEDRHRVVALRIVEADFDLRIQLADNLLRALGEGVELVGGEVLPRVEGGGDVVRGDEDERHGDNADGGVKQGF